MLEPSNLLHLRMPSQPALDVQRRRGFSLLELIIVLTIILIMATVGVYAAQQLLPRIQLDSIAKANDVLLKRMRLLAIKRAIDIDLRVEDASETVRSVAFVNSNPDREYFWVARNVADNSYLASTPLPEQTGARIELLDVSFPAEAIRFTRIGDVAATGVVRYGLSKSPTYRLVRTISIPNLTGRSEVESYEETIP